MKEKQSAADFRTSAGLCADCDHARHIESDRGSVFILCELSRTEQRYPQYPCLPVLSCGGYKKSS
jgi:hypothetical protein